MAVVKNDGQKYSQSNLLYQSPLSQILLLSKFGLSKFTTTKSG